MKPKLFLIALILFFYSCSDQSKTEKNLKEAITLFKAGDEEEALKLFQAFVKTTSSADYRAIAYYYISKIESTKGDYYNAINSLSIAIKMTKKENPILYNDRGFAYQQLEDYNNSIADFNRAISKDAQNHIYFNNRGFSFLKLKEYEKARYDFEKSIKVKPDYAPVYNSFGVLEYQLESYALSLEYFNKAIELKDDYLEAYLNRSYTLLGTGELQQAIDDLNYIKDVDSTYYKADFLMGIIYIGTGDTLGGCALVNNAIKHKVAEADVELSKICSYLQ